MPGKRIIKILIHPFFIGLVLTVLILVIVRPEVSKYRVDVVDRLTTFHDRERHYADLDSDGNSELLVVDHIETMLKIMLFRNERFLAQYNLKSTRVSGEFMHFADADGDGNREICLLTLRGDSIFLSIIDPLVHTGFLVHERLVYTNDTIRYEVDIPQGQFAGMIESRDGRNANLLFSFSTGFELQPRQVFAYNMEKDTVLRSPAGGASLRIQRLFDLDRDSVPEILLETSATGNHHTPIPYTDQSAWLMVLNSRLEFVFDPVEFPGHPSYLKAEAIYDGDTAWIIVLYFYYGTGEPVSRLMLMNRKGQLVRSVPLEGFDGYRYFLEAPFPPESGTFFLVDAVEGLARRYTTDLQVIEEREIPVLARPRIRSRIDLDMDGKLDYHLLGVEAGAFVLARSGFRDPLVVDLEESAPPVYMYPLFRDGKQYLYVQFRSNGYVLDYRRNPVYFWRMPLIVCGYLALSLLVYLVFRVQRYRAQQSYLTHKKIGELQLLSLKNQIDPHFTFNILNSIGSLYARSGNGPEAYGLFVRYSKFLRTAIQRSDKLDVTLEEELEFVKTFIELEQFRGGTSFRYSIDVAGGIDRGRLIPRMLIHTLVENAIKHGLREEREGKLEIEVLNAGRNMEIYVRDNGPGIAHATGNIKESTGKGLRIIREMIGLFNELHGTKISFSIYGLSLEGEGGKGTEAKISIPPDP